MNVKKLPCILLNPMVHYRIHNRPPLVPMMSRINPGHALTSSFLISILLLSSNLRLGLPSGLFPSRCITKTTNFYPRHATCPALVTEVFNPQNHVNFPVNDVYETSRFVRISGTYCDVIGSRKCEALCPASLFPEQLVAADGCSNERQPNVRTSRSPKYVSPLQKGSPTSNLKCPHFTMIPRPAPPTGPDAIGLSLSSVL